MGFFSKKPKKNKIYSLQDAMKLVSENEGYSVIQEGRGYKIISDEEANSHIEIYKARNKDMERLRFQEGLRSGVSDTITVNPERTSNYIYRYNYSSEERE